MKTFFKQWLVLTALVCILVSALRVPTPTPQAPRPEPEIRMTPSQYTKAYADKIVKLTPPDLENTGGTGFVTTAKSGRTVTITNSHVCGLAVDGYMAARWDNGDKQLLAVAERDEEHDLCVLSGLKDKKGLPISWHSTELYDEVFTIGHPHLNPITYSAGLTTQQTDIELMTELDEKQCKEKHKEWKNIEAGFFSITGCFAKYDTIETSIVGYPGNSGSPVFNSQGEVTGVVFVGDGSTNYLGYVPLKYLTKLLDKY